MEFKGRSRAALELNIAPLIDVVFLLLIFFMLTSTMIKDQALEINLPSSSTSKPIESSTITVAIEPSGAVTLNEKPHELSSLKEALRGLISSKPDSIVILKSDNTVQVQKLVSVMDTIKEAGGVNISIATKGEQ